MAKFLEENHSFDEYKVFVGKYHDLIRKIPYEVEHVVKMGMYEVHREDFIYTLTSSAEQLRNQLTNRLVTDYTDKCRR